MTQFMQNHLDHSNWFKTSTMRKNSTYCKNLNANYFLSVNVVNSYIRSINGNNVCSEKS